MVSVDLVGKGPISMLHGFMDLQFSSFSTALGA